MTWIYRFYLGVFLLSFACRLTAAEQDIPLAQSAAAPIDARLVESSVLGRFELAFQRNARTEFASQFQTLELTWREIDAENAAPEVFSAQSFGAASHALSRSIVTGLHAATLNLPVMAWLEGDAGFLANFLRDSVESVESDTEDPRDVPAHFSGPSWWRRQLQTGALAYGVRPFRTDPYAFLSWGLKDGADLLLATHVRYYCRNFADHKFEFCLSIPLARQFSCDFGASYQFGRHDDERRMAVRLFRALPGGTLIHVGLEFRARPELFAGISFPI